VWASQAFWVDNDQYALEVILLGRFVFCLSFWVVFTSSLLFDWIYLQISGMYFRSEGLYKGCVCVFGSVEFVPAALMVCDGEVLQSFFNKEEAGVSVFVSWVICWYYVDMRVG
jgi:hypothetical protein